MSIEQFLIASPIVFYGFYAVLLGWSVVFGRRKRQQAMLDQAGDGQGGSALKRAQHPTVPTVPPLPGEVCMVGIEP